MLGHTLVLMFAGLLLGFTVSGGWLFVSAAAFGWLCLMSAVWVWRVATGRTGFFTRRF
jgi:hypothetical protein